MVAHDAAVERETAALSAAIGDPVSNSSEESKLCIFESFLVVHYMGAHSVKPEANGSRAVGITGHVMANFFNTIGRTAQHGERSFPFEDWDRNNRRTEAHAFNQQRRKR